MRIQVTQKSEIRRPKSEGSPKNEGQKPAGDQDLATKAYWKQHVATACRPARPRFRVSGFGLPSDFEFRSSDFPLRRRRPGGFTLIEIMVVVVILGILAATIIPQFIGTKQEAQVNTAKASVAELKSALERFYIHMDRYPTTDEGLKALVEPPSAEDKKWRGPYIELLRPDPWGNPFQYRNPGVQRKTGFDLWSRGADGADGGEGDSADIGNWQ